MTQRNASKSRKSRKRVTSQHDYHMLLDMLLALDRRVVEASMRRYNIPRRDRSVIRAQQRRLHDALSEIRAVAATATRLSLEVHDEHGISPTA